jgi:hypothetical protein
MSNPIETVEVWLFSVDPRSSEDVGEDTLDSIQEVLEHAKLSDTYVRLIYEAIGFMFKDAATAMQQGRTDKYREMTPEEMFDRVQEVLELPMPLDMAPAFDDIPDAANDIPSIITLD